MLDKSVSNINGEAFFSEEIIESIKYTESSPKVIKNFLSIDEVNELIEIEENATGYFVLKDEGRRTSLGLNGEITKKPVDEWHPRIKELIGSKLREVIGEFDIAENDYPPHYFRTKFPNKIHADTGRDKFAQIYKQILLPLLINPTGGKAHTIIFKNKWYGQASNFVGFTPNESQEQNHSTMLDDNNDFIQFRDINEFYKTLISTNDSKIKINNGIFTVNKALIDRVRKRVAKPNDDARYNKMTNGHITNNKPFNKDIYKKYLTHQEYDDLTGLEVELIYEWKVGDLLIWDRSQLHSSDDYGNFGVKEKLGLAAFTCKKKI